MHTSSVCNISIQIVTYMYMYILQYLTCCIKTIIAIQKKTKTIETYKLQRANQDI